MCVKLNPACWSHEILKFDVDIKMFVMYLPNQLLIVFNASLNLES